MALYIPRGIFHLARLLYVRPGTFGPTPIYHTVIGHKFSYTLDSIILTVDILVLNY
jgi:hypothetical protein